MGIVMTYTDKLLSPNGAHGLIERRQKLVKYMICQGVMGEENRHEPEKKNVEGWEGS